MDSDLCRAFNKSISRRTARLDPGARDAPEWKGTGLCAEAQADGVPCTDVGRSCDVCERAASRSDPAPRPEVTRRQSGTEI